MAPDLSDPLGVPVVVRSAGMTGTTTSLVLPFVLTLKFERIVFVAYAPGPEA